VVVALTRAHSCLSEVNPCRSVYIISKFSCSLSLIWCPCVWATVLAAATINVWGTGSGGINCGCDVRSSRWRVLTLFEVEEDVGGGSCGANGVVLTLVCGLGSRNARNILAHDNNQLVNILTLPFLREWIRVPYMGELCPQVIDELGADFILRIRDTVIEEFILEHLEFGSVNRNGGVWMAEVLVEVNILRYMEGARLFRVEHEHYLMKKLDSEALEINRE